MVGKEHNYDLHEGISQVYKQLSLLEIIHEIRRDVTQYLLAWSGTPSPLHYPQPQILGMFAHNGFKVFLNIKNTIKVSYRREMDGSTGRNIAVTSYECYATTRTL